MPRRARHSARRVTPPSVSCEIMPVVLWARPARGGSPSWQDCRVTEASWTVVVPIKRLSAAKSRLRGAFVGVPHERLALALAQDTVAAVLACEPVADVLLATADL